MTITVKELIITKDDLNENNEYTKSDSIDFDGHVTFCENLGTVKIKKSIKLTGYLEAKAGSGIKAGWGIEAGAGIKAGWGIEAGAGIKAGDGIKAGWGIEAGAGIKAGWGIEAGEGIKAGEGIEAGWGIEAGEGIKAGSGIEAGEGIKAGEGIEAGSGIKAGDGIITLRFNGIIAKWVSALRIAVGFNIEEEQTITAEIRKGKVILGKIKEPEKRK